MIFMSTYINHGKHKIFRFKYINNGYIFIEIIYSIRFFDLNFLKIKPIETNLIAPFYNIILLNIIDRKIFLKLHNLLYIVTVLHNFFLQNVVKFMV